MNVQQALELATQHHRAGRRQEAHAIYKQILAQDPNQPDALRLMGVLAHESGRQDMAVDLIGRAIALQPDAPGFYADLASAQAAMGRLEDALASYQQAMNLDPKSFEILNRRGGVQMQMGRVGDAIASFRQAVELRGDSVDAMSNLATALMIDGKMDEAIETGKRVLAINPNLPTVWNNMALALVKANLFEQAIVAFEKALALSPGGTDTFKDLAAAQLEAGRAQEAIGSCDRALAANPHDAVAAGARLYAMNFLPEPDAEGLYSESRQWNAKFAAPLQRQMIPLDNNRAPDRVLRVGYLSPAPHMHSVAFFIRALLAAHDPGAVEVFFYCDILDSSQISPGLRQYPRHWRNIGGLSDAAAAQIVRNDQIDILVDLSGHTQGNRIMLLARKPAPVQVTYLGYAGTTGLGAMDYRFTDAYADPPGPGDKFYSEKLIRLPGSFLCMLPDNLLPPISPLPAESAGHITFGTFERLAKINPRMIDLCSQILHKTQGSRLLIQCAALTDPNSRERLASQFAKKGIDRQRLDFQGWIRDRREHLQAYSKVDIALDTYPYNGRAATCEALWMGVPVVTLAGRTHASRVGASILANAGLERFVAKNAENYVRLAVELANDRKELLRLRSELRMSMQQSPLMDAKTFAANVEAAYRQMWRQWCAGAPQLESSTA